MMPSKLDSSNITMQTLDLETAQKIIVATCKVLPSKQITLADAVGRVAARPHLASNALPGYDGSLRDGYAIGGIGEGKDNPAVFQVIDEVAAGDTRKLHMQPGEAIRIMTGGLIPAGCKAVIPQEHCERVAETVMVPLDSCTRKNAFILKKGCEIEKNQVILGQGVNVTAEHQVLLAGTGYDSVDLVRKPQIRFFCTGSELVTDTKQTMAAGQRFSANSHLLSGLINRYGAQLREQRTVVDDGVLVVELMQQMAGADCDLVISTGGMGPGKFDLIEDAFAQCGGQTIYRSLNMRPGKSTLFGKLGSTLFFGLPGPPPAVQLLFHELVRPAICALQGSAQCIPQKVEATLSEDLSFPKRGMLRLKSGVFSLENCRCLVRPARKSEVSNCYIFFSAKERVLYRGDKVLLHLTSCLSGSC